MDIEVFKKLLKKKQTGNLSKKEAQVFEKLEKALIENNTNTVFKDDKHANTISNEIFENIQRKITPKKISERFFVPQYIKVAASIALIVSISISYIYFTKNTILQEKQEIAIITKTAIKGKKLKTILPDSSVVILNSGSTITYPSLFKDEYRKVTLKGEAFFDVTENKSKPFIVTTGTVKTTVLGTTFNIEAYNDIENITVTLATGKVKVSNQKEHMYIKPNQQVCYNKTTHLLDKKNVDASHFIDWKEGVLRLKNVTLKEAIKIIERRYGITIKHSATKTYTNKFSVTFKNETLKNILKSISYLNDDIDLEVKPKK